MDCQCAIDIDIEAGDVVDASWTKTQVARKPHICGECRRTIQIGEKYERNTDIYDGKFSTFRTCPDCLSIRDALFCGGWYYGCVWDEVEAMLADTGGNIDWSCVPLLTVPARDKLFEMIEKIWEEEDDDE